MKWIWVLIVVIAGCASTDTGPALIESPTGDPGIVLKRPSNYEEILNRWTRHQTSYQNLSSSFQVTATLLSTSVLDAHLLIDADQFKWSVEKFKEEREKILSTAQNETQVFVSLYTEKDVNNNLDKTSGDWNIFLDTGGKRVAPNTIRRTFVNRVLLVNKYPYHTVWNRGYVVRFPISTNLVATQGVSITLAGPLGSAKLEYPNK